MADCSIADKGKGPPFFRVLPCGSAFHQPCGISYFIICVAWRVKLCPSTVTNLQYWPTLSYALQANVAQCTHKLGACAVHISSNQLKKQPPRTFVMDMESLQELHLVKKDEGGGDDPCLPEKPFAWKLVLASKRSKGTGESGTEEPRVGQQQQQQQHGHSISRGSPKLSTVFTIAQLSAQAFSLSSGIGLCLFHHKARFGLSSGTLVNPVRLVMSSASSSP
eukprot:scaffold93731_cov17-Tisochrysis_lutea.AAC.2